MARKIVKLTKEDFKKAVSKTHWPEFMQKTFVYKLMKRRNRIAKLFLLNTPDEILPEDNPRTRLVISESNLLQTFSDFGIASSVNASYKDPILRLNKYFESKGKRRRFFPAQGHVHIEYLVTKKGELMDCDRTLLMDALERTRHPSGLQKRVSRIVDHHGQSGCSAKHGSYRSALKEVLGN